MFIVKTEPQEAAVGSTISCSVRALYGGAAAKPGDDAFVWYSETQGGKGLAWRSRIAGISTEGAKFKITLQLIEKPNQPFGNSELNYGQHDKPGAALYGLYTKLYDHSHNKIAAIADNEAQALSQYFSNPSSGKPEFSLQPYNIGSVYNRRQDIHQRYGGQERGGIATPADCNFVFLFTGDQGEQFGYADGLRPDGIFEYTGEGQVGDMQFVRGNRAIRDHSANGKELLLFQAQKKKGEYQFIGKHLCQGFEWQDSEDRDGNVRKAIVFHLTQEEAQDREIDELVPTKSIEQLRDAAYEAAKPQQMTATIAAKTVYSRSKAVRDFVLARAAGICECCIQPAPFKRKDGSPYLEPHHTTRLSDGGLDHPRWVAGVCPTCHRRIHSGADGKSLNEKLQLALKSIDLLWQP